MISTTPAAHPFRMVDMIQEKKEGRVHSAHTIQQFVSLMVEGQIPDYQISAWLMAVYFQGLTLQETVDLTAAMADSGDKLDLTGLPKPWVDKHSTGGVGDKVTIILAPLLAACGLTTAKLSGRGLAHTGGTADKLEAIPGFQVGLSETDFFEQLKKIRVAVVTQTKKLAPADGILYALRDVTSTVNSLPLICASILSKKLASGADTILLDVKAGSGAFMPDQASAKQLAQLLQDVGTALGKKIICVITGMEQPLGHQIGHAHEIIEAIEVLKNQGPEDLTILCVKLTAELLLACEKVDTLLEGEQIAQEKLVSGQALELFREMITQQHGDPKVLDDLSLIKVANKQIDVVAPQTGVVSEIKALQIGQAIQVLGGGRVQKTDSIDLSVGICLQKKVGDLVQKGEIIAFYNSNGQGEAEATDLIQSAYQYTTSQDILPVIPPLIYEVLR
jgi:pyrimidine-nucleoside phosphorylase